MDALLKVTGGIALAAALLFAACIASTAIGAIGGWCVGLLFDDTIAAGQRAFGIGVSVGDGPIMPLQCWQLGAFLGFVGAFFKTTLSPSKKG